MQVVVRQLRLIGPLRRTLWQGTGIIFTGEVPEKPVLKGLIMIKKVVAVGTMLIAVAACDAPTHDAGGDFTRVTDAATFEAAVVGRNLNNVNDAPSVFFRLNSDGSMNGDVGRGPLSGNWAFRDGYWCRTWTAGLKETSLNSENCQLVELRVGEVALSRDRGEGNRGIYVIQ